MRKLLVVSSVVVLASCMSREAPLRARARTEVLKPPVTVLVPEAPSEDPAPADGDTPTRVGAMYLRHYGVNPTIETSAERFSTFAADVDTGSYSLARNYLSRGVLPDEGAVRVEEFINAFDYGYRAPEREAFGVQVEVLPSPNRLGYHLLHLGVKGREVSRAQRKPTHLVFCIDVSGSMDMENRLGLVKQSLALLVGELDARDVLSIVVYGDTARQVLPPTPADQKERILEAIAGLRPEGATNAQAGLELAYATALTAFKPGGINRVMLLSDGVANSGIADAEGLWAQVKGKASEGITLSTIGFGMGNYNDVLMERLADRGDGHYAYVDRLDEARRIFVQNLTGTLQVIARDVKLQLEFNPAVVQRYRLLGFENRLLDKRDFANDQVDGGEVGAGHAVTAVYEVKLASTDAASFATFRARFKAPQGGSSVLVEKALPMSLVRASSAGASGPTRLSLVVAGFAEKLRGSYWARNLSWRQLLAQVDDLPPGLRGRADVVELRQLITTAAKLDRRPDRFEDTAPVASMDFDRVPVLE